MRDGRVMPLRKEMKMFLLLDLKVLKTVQEQHKGYFYDSLKSPHFANYVNKIPCLCTLSWGGGTIDPGSRVLEPMRMLRVMQADTNEQETETCISTSSI